MTAVGWRGVVVVMIAAVFCRYGLMMLVVRVFGLGMGMFHAVRVCGHAEEPGSIEDQAHAQQDTHQHGG